MKKNNRSKFDKALGNFCNTLFQMTTQNNNDKLDIFNEVSVPRLSNKQQNTYKNEILENNC